VSWTCLLHIAIFMNWLPSQYWHLWFS